MTDADEPLKEGADLPYQRLAAALADDRPAKARNILNRIIGRRGFDGERLNEIDGLLIRHGCAHLLKDALLEAATSGHLPEEVLPELESYAERHGFLDAWHQAIANTAASAAPMTANAPSFEERVRQRARTVGLDERIADKLFSLRQRQDMTREEWEEKLRFAKAIEAITDEAGFTSDELDALFAPETKDAISRLTQDGRSRVFIIGHVGFTAARNHFIRRYLPKSIPFRTKHDRPPYVWEEGDGRTALFACLKALSAGTSIVLAADGPVGEVRSPITVAGCPATIATGGAFLAHESKASAIWLNIIWKDGVFAAVLEPGPDPLPKERLKDYQARFVGFYERMLNEYFSGDPSSIVIRNRWRAAFLGRTPRGED